jgi:hypothetical protein
MNDSENYQIRFWQELVQLKVHIYYLQYFQLNAQSRENSLNIFLAAASNGSIATWAIWGKVTMLWAFIIGASQLVTAIRPYLPYQNRIKAISALIRELDELSLYSEHKWYAVAEGTLSNEQIHEEIIELKKRKSKAISTYLGSSPLSVNKVYLKKAEDDAETYFYSSYGLRSSHVRE